MRLRKKHKLAIFKALLGPMFKNFCVIVVVVMIISWARAWFLDALSLYEDWALHFSDLSRIFLIAFFSLLPSILLEVFVEASTARGQRAKKIIRFLAITVLVLGFFAIEDGRGDFSFGIGTVASFLLVYAAISIYFYFNAITIDIREKKLAEQINQQLDEIHSSENES